jgi:WD40 repeat protein
MSAALVGGDLGHPAGAAGLRTSQRGGRGMGDPGRLRLKQVASVDLRHQGDQFSWSVSEMAWSPDGSRLVAVNGLGNFLNVIDTSTWRLLVRFRIMSVDGQRPFGFAAGGRDLIASKRVDPGGTENPPAFSVFEADTGRILRESQLLPVFLPALSGRPNDLSLQQRREAQDLAVSPDGRFVFLTFQGGVAATRRRFSYLYDGETGQLLGEGEGGHWTRPTISRDNRMAVRTLTPRGNVVPDAITVYSLPSLTKLLSFPAHLPGIKSLAWSPCGNELATGAAGLTHPREDESIRVWNSRTGEQLAGFVGEFEPVETVDWHLSGTFFVADSSKGTGARGSLMQLLPANGGVPLLQHFGPDRFVINAPCFCQRTGRLAWHQQGRIFIYEIEGL